MKSLAAICLLLIIIASCTTSKKTGATTGNTDTAKATTNSATLSTPANQDGLTFKTAVFVTEKSELTGPAAEYKWIKAHYSDYKVKGQALVYNEKKPFDIITIILSDGKELKLYFDISNYFGKY